MKKKIIFVFLFVLAFQSLFASGKKDDAQAAEQGQVKYMFLFIGDGKAMAQISAAQIFSTATVSNSIQFTPLNFTQFPAAGFITTFDEGSFITDSSSAATAIASGNKTWSGVVNMDSAKTKKFKTIAEYAHGAGMKVGIVSTVTLNHATPAAFYAKAPSRNDYYDIALQLAESGFEYFAGGSIDQRRGPNGDRSDAVGIAINNGYTYIDTKEAFLALKPGAEKVIAVSPVLQDAGAMKFEIDRLPDELSLADYTKKGIELLENPKGFFMMVEGGKIDWACHANDAATAIHDVLALDAAVKTAVDFAKKHPNETLIVVTGDHETGGMSIGFAGTQYSAFLELLALQKRSNVAFNEEIMKPYKEKTSINNAKLDDLSAEIKEYFGIEINSLNNFQKQQLEFAFQRSMGDTRTRSVLEDSYLLYGGYEPLTVKLTQIINQTAGIGWTSYSHTGIPLPVFASGINMRLFNGYFDNTDLFHKMAAAMGLKVK